MNSVNPTKNHWYDLFDHIYNSLEIPTGIDCLHLCQAFCCPRHNIPGPHVGTFVIFLPYELEYISSILQVSVSGFKFSWNIVTLENGDTLTIPWTRECPFVEKNQCGIYPARPIDCRSFPLLIHPEGSQFTLEINTNCPGYQNVTQNFQVHMESVWMSIYSSIPPTWFELLNSIETGALK